MFGVLLDAEFDQKRVRPLLGLNFVQNVSRAHSDQRFSGQRRRWIYLVSLVFSVLAGCYLFWRTQSFTYYQGGKPNTPLNIPSTLPKTFTCPSIPGLDDIHVILKTGATEALGKLPVHANTTLQCIPHYTIFSDYEEDISGLHVHDVLRGVDDKIKNTHPDFKLYTALRDSGRPALSTFDITANDDKSTPSGKPNNPGWLLDKWKFLPMMHETLKTRPSAKWYIFMEADTYIIWPNLLRWLATFNPNEPYYLGNQMQIGEVLFAHGGSGFVLSHAALTRVAEYHAPRVKEWDAFTDHHWAGDCVLGKALKDAGVGLLWSWPMMQGSTPWAFDHLSPKYGGVKPWCYPVVAYHHVTPDDIRGLWDFEQGWRDENGDKLLLHSDVFRNLIQPRFNELEQDWDNGATDLVEEKVNSAADCAARCADDAECLQYSYEPGKCRTSKTARGGSGSKPGIISGWMAERINQTMTQLGSCERIDWIHP
ncbi:hypothetical protein FQN55_006221 [Onygenales sp. PD_40]|nr:hypothetical protein FQN55_006221 [Onygenales sp. PD_40]